MPAKRKSDGPKAGIEATSLSKRAKGGVRNVWKRRDGNAANALWEQSDLLYLKRLQKLNAPYDPSSSYVKVRRLLVDFIVDVCEELRLQSVTVHRSVNYLDRLLVKRTDISRAHYQLFATACIFVAGPLPAQPVVRFARLLYRRR